MEKTFKTLLTRLYEVNDLNAANAVLSWDQSTYMPVGGGAARAAQLATLQRVAHERFADPEVGQWLEALTEYEADQPFDSFEASLIRVTRRNYERWRLVPAEFMAELTEMGSQAYQTWLVARPASDFTRVMPYLERALEMSRTLCEYLAHNVTRVADGPEHLADPLVDMFEPGLSVAEVRTLFAQLRGELVPLVEAVTGRPDVSDACLRAYFPEREQLAFCNWLIERLGYDFERGRQDKSAHPYMTRFSGGDVRITTRVRENYLGECLFSMLHEMGHALYEQGVALDIDRTPLAGGASAGVHESQSRLWENLVGRSHGFWEHFYPELQHRFPAQLGAVSLNEFYRAINKVERSLIRTDADEVTYNLHVMLRFDLEMEMLEGSLAVRDLPEAWNARMRDDLAVEPPDHALGVMQDMHWFWGVIGGAFQGYTLGNIMSAQIYATALAAQPDIPAQIAQGQAGPLHTWLRENVYQHGAKFTPPELIERVTGRPLTIEPYLQYLRGKYHELYGL